MANVTDAQNADACLFPNHIKANAPTSVFLVFIRGLSTTTQPVS